MRRELNLAAAICLSVLTVGAVEAGSLQNNGPITSKGGAPEATMAHNGGTFTVAGVLGHSASRASDLEVFDDYVFVAAGNRILFAELKAAIYQSHGSGRGDHDEHMEAAAAAAAAGGGCGGGGRGRTCLQLLDAQENVLCWAERPKHPGWWGGDPHLACILDYPKDRPKRLTLRVSMADEDCSDLVYPLLPLPLTHDDRPFALPYLLSVQSKAIASEGPVSRPRPWIRDRF